jgi:CelD/BcsL family acetyltransferase involved in cellulose biosynthesis
VTVAFEDGRHDLTRLLDEGFAVERSGWKAERGTAIAQSAQTDRFYRDVAAWAAERGWLQLGFLRVDGRAIAFNYSIVVAGTVNVVKVGFDSELRRYAPGTILTRAAIERAYAQGLRRYDFLGGDDRYKLDWTNDVRERVRVQAFGRTGRGIVGFAAWRYGRPAAKWAVAAVRERAGRRDQAA